MNRWIGKTERERGGGGGADRQTDRRTERQADRQI